MLKNSNSLKKQVLKRQRQTNTRRKKKNTHKQTYIFLKKIEREGKDVKNQVLETVRKRMKRRSSTYAILV